MIKGSVVGAGLYWAYTCTVANLHVHYFFFKIDEASGLEHMN